MRTRSGARSRRRKCSTLSAILCRRLPASLAHGAPAGRSVRRAASRGRATSPDGAKRNPGSTCPLAEIHHGFFDIARPVGWHWTAPDIDAKRRIWPFERPTHQLVLDRVEVHVVDVSFEINL